MIPLRVLCAAGVAAAIAGGVPAVAQEGGPKPEELFKQLDKDGNGTLKADEVPEAQRRFFDRLVRVGDKDNDGSLTREEFVQASRPGDNPAVPLQGIGGGPGRPGQAGDARQRFEMLDRNKDGKITRDELQEAPEPVRDRLQQLFERAGKNELTMEEFGRFAGGPPNAPQPGEFFNRLDRNRDGKITKDEIPAEAPPFITQLFERLGKDEISREEFQDVSRRMFAQQAPGRPEDGRRPLQQPRFVMLLDSDKDGRLSKDELAKFVEKFNELDENSDGQLDPRELMGQPPGMTGAAPEGGRPNAEGRPRPQPSGTATGPFARMDRNSDGKLSKDEAPERLRENFNRFDKDSDGYLTPEELRAAFEQIGRPNQ